MNMKEMNGQITKEKTLRKSGSFEYQTEYDRLTSRIKKHYTNQMIMVNELIKENHDKANLDDWRELYKTYVDKKNSANTLADTIMVKKDQGYKHYNLTDFVNLQLLIHGIN